MIQGTRNALKALSEMSRTYAENTSPDRNSEFLERQQFRREYLVPDQFCHFPRLRRINTHDDADGVEDVGADPLWTQKDKNKR